jgi:hypothetical protein
MAELNSHLDQFMAEFTERWAPQTSARQHHDFDQDLLRLVRIIYQEATDPWRYELNKFRDAALTDMLLRPIIKKEI